MRIDKAFGGGLAYGAEVEGVKLTFLGIPRVLPDEPETCMEALRTMAGQMELGRPAALPRSNTGFHGCEVESKKDGKPEYWAIVGTPAGGVVVVTGDAPSAVFSTWRPRFAAAVRSLRSTPGRAGK
jgi:hypothetical protein